MTTSGEYGTCAACDSGPLDPNLSSHYHDHREHDPEPQPEHCGACRDMANDEWDYLGGYSRSDLLFGGNW